MNFNALKHNQMQDWVQNYGEFMDYNQNVDMHVEIYEEQPQIQEYVHACMNSLSTLYFKPILYFNSKFPWNMQEITWIHN